MKFEAIIVTDNALTSPPLCTRRAPPSSHWRSPQSGHKRGLIRYGGFPTRYGLVFDFGGDGSLLPLNLSLSPDLVAVAVARIYMNRLPPASAHPTRRIKIRRVAPTCREDHGRAPVSLVHHKRSVCALDQSEHAKMAQL